MFLCIRKSCKVHDTVFIICFSLDIFFLFISYLIKFKRELPSSQFMSSQLFLGLRCELSICLICVFKTNCVYGIAAFFISTLRRIQCLIMVIFYIDGYFYRRRIVGIS